MVDFRKKLQEQRLQEQLAKVKNQGAVNLNPSYSSRATKEKEPPPPDLNTFDMKPADRLQLRILLKRHIELSESMGISKTEKDALAERIKELCKIYSLDKFTYEGRPAAYYTSTRTKISMEKLLAHGVDPDTIKACTVITSESETFRFTDRKSSKGELDE